MISKAFIGGIHTSGQRGRLLAFAALALTLASCGMSSAQVSADSQSEQILGRWTCKLSDGSSSELFLEKEGKGTVAMKGELAQDGEQRTFDYVLDIHYTIANDRLSMTPTGAHVKQLTLNGETVDLATLGGREALEQRMVSGIVISAVTITSLDEHELQLKEDRGGLSSCKR